MRFSFKLDERKFRAMLHLHDYHNEKKIMIFWSDLTQIPISQFSKSYKKPHTGKRKREGYPGSTRIRYYYSKIALELRTIYNTFADSLGL
ncbi:MAG: hypothetical protein ACD_52C00077G0001 [uncultured bacterium]|nr:MAG: hypothetical protein ACD_52C00077G0001 [uncultured bacterium]